ncbi:hypothetical protein [Micromonospora maris]|uniref:hypothetical protein n=1 Tax=Micromonospora maris TaxID=1003110 RepID=UPI002E1008D2|nr:hypothetical protein OG712_06665 [Micromonospora maris]
MLAAAGALPPPEEPLDEPPVEPDDEVLDGVDGVLVPEEDESDPLDLLVVLLDVLSEPDERESVR